MTKTTQVHASEVRPGDRVSISGYATVTVTHYEGRDRIQVLADGREIFGHSYGIEVREDDPYVESVCLTEEFPVTVQRG
jgi:hypothetical protein